MIMFIHLQPSLSTCRDGAVSHPTAPNPWASGLNHGRQKKLPCYELLVALRDSRRRDCHFADAPPAALLKRLMKGEGGVQQNDSLTDGYCVKRSCIPAHQRDASSGPGSSARETQAANPAPAHAPRPS